MNKIVIAMCSVAAMSVATLAYAGAGCCAAKQAGMGKGGAAMCSPMLAKLNLTDAQKTKVDALMKECKSGKCSKASHAKFMTGLKEILTAQQWDQFKAECHPGAAGCAASPATKTK